MQVFVRGYCTMIAAPVQCDVDGIPKGTHSARVTPMGHRILPCSPDYIKSQVCREWIEIPIAMQEVISALDAACGNHCIDGLAVCFFQAEDGIRDLTVTGVQTCALPILPGLNGLMSPLSDRTPSGKIRTE